ncbi:hypothetical protein [Capnocytophaga ochracea]|jgi:hypothetical protein|uniref:Uncharacterized protein n=1 Tax=Capnocytophaga ochracea TaxID=1018 RepID=A0A2X2T0K4_CAPOC|nr:hypothetical protein [Capnocytophaga ochracea]SQA93983.1 Uncharacterised protein [Capnocytophaga ochracea]
MNKEAKTTITTKAYKEATEWLVSLEIEVTPKEGKPTKVRSLLTTEQTTELMNKIKFANYTAKSQNHKKP